MSITVPSATPPDEAPCRPSLEQLELLGQVIRAVARTHRLTPDDAQDFGQSVHLKLLERNYDVFARYAGGSTLRTFLTVVVNRLLIDWQRARFGKWRRSARAAQLGPYAMALDRLIFRDGYSPEQAVRVVRGMKESPEESALMKIVEQLPAHPVRRVVPDDDLDNLPGAAFEDPVEIELRAAEAQRIRSLLHEALRELPPQDRWLLTARYQKQQKVCAMAATLGVDAAQLYRRCDRALRRLRAALANAGVASVTNLLV